MGNLFKSIIKKSSRNTRIVTASINDDVLSHLAFDNAAQANIITMVSNGKIIMANTAACKLLAYSKKELLTKSRSEIFDFNETGFKKMLKQRTAEGRSTATVFAIKKNGKKITCEITSAVFTDGNGVKNAITTITDMSNSILLQKKIDTKNKKAVASDIALAKSKQKQVDSKKDKRVADNIILAISKQKKIDIINVKKVTDDIALAKSKQKQVDSKKDKQVADNIILARSKQKKIDIINVKKVTDDIALAKSKQKQVDIKKDKLVAANIIVAQAKSDARLSENNQWIKYIAKTSYDIMWDWDIISGEIYTGDSVKEVFGYQVRNNTISFADFCRNLLPEEKDIVEKKIFDTLAAGGKLWNDAFMFKRYDGSIASTISRASIVRDESGKAIHMIGAIQDVSRLQELEQSLEAQIVIHQEDSDKFMLAAKLSFDVIWDWNLETNEVFLGDGFEELFGYKIKNNKGDMMLDWVTHLHPDDKENVMSEMFNSIKSTATHWELGYRVCRSDNTIARVYVRASIIRHADGKAYRVIGAMQDLSRQNDLEEKLEEQIRFKEKQIEEATQDAKETERLEIGKELHDNINQLLSASRMYLQMAKRGDGNSAMYLNRSSEYTSSAIDEIRKLTKGLTTGIIKNLGLCDVIKNTVRDMVEVNQVKISCSFENFKEAGVNDKFKHDVFRIIQKQLNNILKHAKAKKVMINIAQNKKVIILSVSDDGKGFDTGIKHTGIGLQNIKNRASIYKGKIDIDSKPGGGCVLTVIFPITDMLRS